MIDNGDLRHFAGIFEGEGWFEKGGNIRLAMSDKDTVEWVAKVCGGSVRPKKVREGDKPMWRWTLSGAKARALAAVLYPWLFARRKAQCRAAFPGLAWPSA